MLARAAPRQSAARLACRGRCRARAAAPGGPPRRGILHVPIIAGAAALAKLLVVKKVGFWGAYGATKVYGWPRVARRLLKFNKDNTPLEAQGVVQAGVVTAIRAPSQAYGVFQDTQVYAFVGKVARDTSDTIPAWVRTLAGSIAGKTHVWKALKELESESQKIKAAKMAAEAGAREHSWQTALSSARGNTLACLPCLALPACLPACLPSPLACPGVLQRITRIRWVRCRPSSRSSRRRRPSLRRG